MTAPAFVAAAVVHVDTTANASPITTDSYVVSASGHTLIVVIDHERQNSTTPLNITGITRNGQSFSRANKGDLGSAASVDVADMWILENADVGSYALSVSHNGVTGGDIEIGVVEYDGGTLGDVSTPAYVPGSSAAVATFDITIPADARLVYLQVVTTAGGTWTGPSHGTSRLTSTVATGTAGGAMAVADYVPASPPESATAISYAFTPASGNWTNGSNHVIGIILEAVPPAEEIEVTPGAITYVGQDIGVGEFSLPVITRPDGGGDVDVAATVITNGYSATPTIALAGDPESNENITGTRWEGLYTNVLLDQAARTPTFTLDFLNWRQTTPPANNKLYWRLGSDIGDLYAWTPFDNRSVGGSLLTVSNSTPFAEATVQVANIPPVPYDELRAWIAAHDGHANVFRPQACVTADLGSGADAYGYYEFASQVSPDGIEVGGTLAYAIGITKPGVIPPGGKRRIFHTWTHAGEWGGLRAMMRAMDRLIAETSADDTVMVEAGEHIFLVVNTAGMVGGLARGSAEPGDLGEDTNRVWGSDATDRSDVSDPQGVVEASVALIVTEWGLNGSGKINCVGQIAWHSHTFSTTKFGTYKDGMSATESAVISSIETAYGSPLHNYSSSSTGSSTAFARSACVGSFGITFEWSYGFADFINEIGASVDTIIPALADAYAAGLFGETVTLDAGAITYVGQTINVPGSSTITVEPAALTYVGQEILIRNPIPVQLLPGAITYVGANITVRSGTLPEGGGLMAGRAVSPGMLLSRIWS